MRHPVLLLISGFGYAELIEIYLPPAVRSCSSEISKAAYSSKALRCFLVSLLICAEV